MINMKLRILEGLNGKMSKKYSVLMSVYYKEKPDWLNLSIKSMLEQTIPADEFLIVKDGALTPELDRIIDKYAESNPGLFTILPLSENIGLGPALAKGLGACRNELIIRMDSDDFSVPERCEKLLSLSEEHPEYGVIGSYEVEFEGEIKNEIAVHKVPEKPVEVREFMKRRCALLHPTVLYKKSIIEACGNYRSVRLYEDYDLFMRVVLENGVPCANIPENLYYIRINDDFFRRRGGFSYMKTAVGFKNRQRKKGYISTKDFIVSAGGQAVVCLMPNKMRKKFYLKFLR